MKMTEEEKDLSILISHRTSLSFNRMKTGLIIMHAEWLEKR